MTLSLLSLAFSRLSCSVSLLICAVSFLIISDSLLKAFVLASISRTGRQFSIDKNDRQRGNDAGNGPLLGELEGATGERDVVIGGKKRDQANGETTEGLGDAEAVEDKRGGGECSDSGDSKGSGDGMGTGPPRLPGERPAHS